MLSSAGESKRRGCLSCSWPGSELGWLGKSWSQPIAIKYPQTSTHAGGGGFTSINIFFLFPSTNTECWVIKNSNMHFLLLRLARIPVLSELKKKKMSISGEKYREFMAVSILETWAQRIQGILEKLPWKRNFPNTGWRKGVSQIQGGKHLVLWG